MNNNVDPNGADVQISGSSDSADKAIQRTIDLIAEFEKKVTSTQSRVTDLNLAMKLLSDASSNIRPNEGIDKLASSMLRVDKNTNKASSSMEKFVTKLDSYDGGTIGVISEIDRLSASITRLASELSSGVTDSVKEFMDSSKGSKGFQADARGLNNFVDSLEYLGDVDIDDISGSVDNLQNSIRQIDTILGSFNSVSSAKDLTATAKGISDFLKTLKGINAKTVSMDTLKQLTPIIAELGKALEGTHDSKLPSTLRSLRKEMVEMISINEHFKSVGMNLSESIESAYGPLSRMIEELSKLEKPTAIDSIKGLASSFGKLLSVVSRYQDVMPQLDTYFNSLATGVKKLDGSLGEFKNLEVLDKLSEFSRSSVSFTSLSEIGKSNYWGQRAKTEEVKTQSTSETGVIDLERKRLELERRKEHLEQTHRKTEMYHTLESAKNMRSLVSNSKDLVSAFSSGQGFGKLMSSSFSLASKGLDKYSNFSSGATNYINNEAGHMLLSRGKKPLRAPSGNTQFPKYKGASAGAGASGAGATASRAGMSAGAAGVGGGLLVGGAVLIGALALVGAMGALGKKGQEAELKIAQAYTVMGDNFGKAFESIQRYNTELSVSESRIASLVASTARLTSSQGFNSGQSSQMAQSATQLAMSISEATGDNLEDVSAKVEQFLQGQDSLQEYNIRSGGAKAFGDEKGITSVNAQLSEAKASLLQMQYAIFQFNEGSLASVQPANELKQKWEATKSTLDATGEKLYRLFVPVFELLVDLGYGIAKGIESAVDKTIELVEAFRKFGALVSGEEYKPIDWTKGTGLQDATNNIKDLTAGYQQAQEEIEATQGAIFKFDEVNNLTSFDNDLSSLEKLDEVAGGKKQTEMEDKIKPKDWVIGLKFNWKFPTFPTAFSISLAFVESMSALMEWFLETVRQGSPAFDFNLGFIPVFEPVLEWLLETLRQGNPAFNLNLGLVPVFEPILEWLLEGVKNGLVFNPQLEPVLLFEPILQWMLEKLFTGEAFDFQFNFKGAEFFTGVIQPAIQSAITGVSNVWDNSLQGLQKQLQMVEAIMTTMGVKSKSVFYDPVIEFVNYIKGILNQIGESLAQFGSTIWGWVTGIDWGGILNVVANILDVIALAGTIAGVVTGGTTALAGAGVKGVSTLVRGASFAVKGAKAADKASDTAGVLKFLNKVPSYDTGGVSLKPHIAQIGMPGGELALPLNSKSAEPAYKQIASNLTNKMGAGGASQPNYTFEINIASGGNVIADSYSVKKFSETIASQVELRLKQTGVFSQGVRR